MEKTIIKPFGPSILKVKLPQDIIDKLNDYTDTKSKENIDEQNLNAGNKLAGNVSQEIQVENDFVKESGFVQKVTEIRIDDDQDSVWLTVDIGEGASCHVGYRSCFYRSIPLGPIDNARKIEMKFLEDEKKFDPEEVYKGQPNPTKI